MHKPDTDAVAPLSVGDILEVVIGQVAHGGHFIAHAQGRTIFVRHAISGEKVRIRITETGSKIVRADAIEILTASQTRVTSPCEFSGPGGCGGCDFQHIDLAHQRELKQQVVQDALRRHAHLDDVIVPVEAVPGDVNGLYWRTRVRWGVDRAGHLGFHKFRSSAIVPVTECVIASRGQAFVPTKVYPGAREVLSAEGSDGAVAIAVGGNLVAGSRRVSHDVLGRSWRVDLDSFWQVHAGAPDALVNAVIEAGGPRLGETWWDLYSGAGLFSAYLAHSVGEAGSVVAVEGTGQSVRVARRNLHDDRNITLVESDVGTWLAATAPDSNVAGVVLDPPRRGAGAEVVREIAARKPRVVVYVACDPVALARDIATFTESGYRLAQARGFDTFPMTHHVEVVATLVPTGGLNQVS